MKSFIKHDIKYELKEIVSLNNYAVDIAEFTEFKEVRQFISMIYPALTVCNIGISLNIDHEDYGSVYRLKARIFPVEINSRAYRAREHWRTWGEILKSSANV